MLSHLSELLNFLGKLPLIYVTLLSISLKCLLIPGDAVALFLLVPFTLASFMSLFYAKHSWGCAKRLQSVQIQAERVICSFCLVCV